MIYLISYSGGLGSAISSILAHENNLDYEMLFADTLVEDEDLHRFSRDLEKVLDKKIIHLKDGRTPWEVFKDKRYIGNSRTAHCSQLLKTKVIKDYIDSHFSISDPLVLGMDHSEEDRLQRAKKKWEPRPVLSLINKFKFWRPLWKTKLEEYNLVPPRLYEYGFPHNNCGGFCVKTGLKQFDLLKEHFPERFDWHKEQEEKTMNEIGPTARPFLRKTVNNELKYITLKEFEEYRETGQLPIDENDLGGCGCFVDD